MWIERAQELYERGIYAGDDAALATSDRELDAVEAALCLARGRVLHGRVLQGDEADPRELPLFQRATTLFRALGDRRGEGEAAFWEGCFHQVVEGDLDRAVPLFERAGELAAETGDLATLAEVLRHQGIVAHRAGRLDEARERLTESSRLRRELGHPAGVASNQVGLIRIAVAQGRHAEALALADEARALAESCGAGRIAAHVEEARAIIPA
ncbi:MULTISPECIES: tetratricopeptide repeat protein [unclassified Nonomuraea]|uniref:tetratricopeptide repeat protein n=1 Tax=unclassified Nonomuraea TaxID=2593643 RepID=UPI0033FA12F8